MFPGTFNMALGVGGDSSLVDSFNMNWGALGSSIAGPTARRGSRSFGFERTSDFGYTGYAWWSETNVTGNRDYHRYKWQGSSFVATGETLYFPSSSGIQAGFADNGTHICACSTTGNYSIVNKSTGTEVASGSGAGNLQGVLWDGTYFWAGSFNISHQVYRIDPTTTNAKTSYTLPTTPNKSANRGGFYDFHKKYYYFSDTNGAHAYTYDGSSFTYVSTNTDGFWNSCDHEYFQQSDGKKYIIQLSYNANPAPLLYNYAPI